MKPIDWRQAGAVALLTGAVVGLWFAGQRLHMPTEATTPAVMALLGGVIGAMRSYRAEQKTKTPEIPVHVEGEESR